MSIDGRSPPAPGTPAWYESLYAHGAGDPRSLPWSVHGSPDPGLVRWLNAVAPGCVRIGCRALVVGCGLGDEVAELARRGYDATGLDVSMSAIKFAQARHPALASNFIEGDWSVIPSHQRHRFDLVVCVRGLCWTPPGGLLDGARGLAELACPHGRVLVICDGRHDDEPAPGATAAQGPPWRLSANELRVLMSRAGLHAEREVDAFDDATPTAQHGQRAGVSFKLRGSFVRA